MLDQTNVLEGEMNFWLLLFLNINNLFIEEDLLSISQIYLFTQHDVSIASSGACYRRLTKRRALKTE